MFLFPRVSGDLRERYIMSIFNINASSKQQNELCT